MSQGMGEGVELSLEKYETIYNCIVYVYKLIYN